jgi:hypothetical protein
VCAGSAGINPRSIPPAQLCDATLDIPAVADPGCRHGQVAFVKGRARNEVGQGGLLLTTVVYADVDHDGISDPVVLVSCASGAMTTATQVLAFTRGPGDTIRTMGRLVATDPSTIPDITGIYPMADGSVQVLVSNRTGTNGWDYHAAITQRRTYSWTGHDFAQTAGSASFWHNGADLDLIPSAVVFDPAVNGTRAGRVTVTVRNNASQPVPNVSVFLYHLGVVVTGGTCTDGGDPPAPSGCPSGTVPAGGSWQTTITLTIEQRYLSMPGVSDKWTSPDSGIQLRVGDQACVEVHALTVTYR